MERSHSRPSSRCRFRLSRTAARAPGKHTCTVEPAPAAAALQRAPPATRSTTWSFVNRRHNVPLPSLVRVRHGDSGGLVSGSLPGGVAGASWSTKEHRRCSRAT
ncbi:hypothetical protein EYF80_036574 [Liparis tanakae]|uniref:Uncharacterized protein n=1 Tax=Liparis tanakae TaxID=230148 RepID=A0A4Z2GK23_9TELE|nr:hypothetical protein EYF80_036574 [Liparis tanakae]